MYGQNSAISHAEETLRQIEVANIPERNGQILRNYLVDRLNARGVPVQPAYRLEISKLYEEIRDLDVTVRSDTTRELMIFTAEMRLVDLQSDQNSVILRQSLRASGSYNILENEYNARIARQDLRNDLLSNIAEQAERAIALRFTEPRNN